MVWRGWNAAAIGRDADQQQQPGIDAGRHGQHRAVLRQHRVQRDQRLAVGARERAELGAIGEAREFDALAAAPTVRAGTRPSTKTMRGASIRGRRASSVLSPASDVTGCRNDASATGRRLVYFQASSRRPDAAPGRPARGTRRRRHRAAADHRAGAPAAPRSARGSPPRRVCTAAVMPPPRPCRRSPWPPARAPAPARRSGRSGRRPARARGPARCSRAAADSA